MRYLSLFNTRHTLSLGLVMVAALLLEHFFAFTQQGWIVMTAYVVSQTTRGTPLRQGLIIFSGVILAIVFSAGLEILLTKKVWIDVILVAVFVISAISAYLARPLTDKMFYLIMLFALMLLISSLPPGNDVHLLQARMKDVLLGSTLAIVFAQLVFPVKPYNEFRQGLSAITNSMLDYSRALVGYLERRDEGRKELMIAATRIEKKLQAEQGVYPGWVYETGFNPGLRAGFRYFLVHLERMIDLFFSINYLITSGLDNATLHELAHPLIQSMQKNAELLVALLNYFHSNKLTDTHSDFTSDIVALEAALKALVPGGLELLDVSPDLLALTAIVRNVKDMRGLLLQLMMTLPTDNHLGA